MAPILTTADIVADPFGERRPFASRLRMRLLGADFRFFTDNAVLLRLLQDTFGRLPRHRLRGSVPRLELRLVSTATRKSQRSVLAAPRYEAGAGLLCATLDADNYAALSPATRSGLVAISREQLQRPYCVRGELLEFAVSTLAARSQGLVPLHAACVAKKGRALLLMGESGAGKTTLAAQCLVGGFEFLSEDSSFVHPATGLTTGLANFIYLRPSTLRYLATDQAAAIRRHAVEIRRRSGVLKLQVDLRRQGFALASSASRLSAVVFLSRQNAGKGKMLQPVGGRESLRRMESLQSYAAAQPGWELFAKRVAKLQTWELRRAEHPRAGMLALHSLACTTPP